MRLVARGQVCGNPDVHHEHSDVPELFRGARTVAGSRWHVAGVQMSLAGHWPPGTWASLREVLLIITRRGRVGFWVSTLLVVRLA